MIAGANVCNGSKAAISLPLAAFAISLAGIAHRPGDDMEVKNSAPNYGQCFASLALGMAPLSLFFAIAAMFGANTVHYNRQNVHGVSALLICAVLNVLVPAFFAGLQKIGFMFLALIRREQPQG